MTCIHASAAGVGTTGTGSATQATTTRSGAVDHYSAGGRTATATRYTPTIPDPGTRTSGSTQVDALGGQLREALRQLRSLGVDVPDGLRFAPPSPPQYLPQLPPMMMLPPMPMPPYAPLLLAPPMLMAPPFPGVPAPPTVDPDGRPLFAPDGSTIDWSSMPAPPDAPPYAPRRRGSRH